MPPSTPAHDPLTEAILGCAIKVSRDLGPGFLEKVYENALAIEMRHAGLHFEQQKGIEVWYRGEPAGHFAADFLVEGRILLELKAVKALDEAHLAQGLNYLRSTGLDVCLLLNFGGSKLEIRRLVPGPDWPIPSPAKANRP